MSVTHDLTRWFSQAQRIVIVGVGNPLRRDDNIGVEIVSGLEGKVSKAVLLIKSETVPESFIEQIIEFRPTHILIIDAALLNLSPGQVKLEESLKVSPVAISTHTLPIQIFCEHLTRMISVKIAMLLIQPENTNFGEGLTRRLNIIRNKLVDDLIKILEKAVD